jgi:uncharacterized membrane protein
MIARAPRTLEDAVGRVLLTGVVVAALVIALGLVLLILVGTDQRALLAPLFSASTDAPARPPALGSLLAGILRGHPLSVISLGLLLLVLTPVARVLVAGIYFAQHGERLHALISGLVLALLLLGVVMGATT